MSDEATVLFNFLLATEFVHISSAFSDSTETSATTLHMQTTNSLKLNALVSEKCENKLNERTNKMWNQIFLIQKKKMCSIHSTKPIYWCIGVYFCCLRYSILFVWFISCVLFDLIWILFFQIVFNFVGRGEVKMFCVIYSWIVVGRIDSVKMLFNSCEANKMIWGTSAWYTLYDRLNMVFWLSLYIRPLKNEKKK